MKSIKEQTAGSQKIQKDNRILKYFLPDFIFSKTF